MPGKPIHPADCEQCGESFFATKSRLNSAQRHFCTRSCYADWTRENPIPSTIEAMRAARAKYPETLRTGMKECPKRNEVKPLDEFGKDNKRPDGHKPYCKACRQLEESNPEFKRARGRRYVYKSYGIDETIYAQMLAEQDGLCAICRRVNNLDKPLYVDHDHETGAVRGLLCQRCNTAIGMMEDDTEMLLSAICYPRRSAESCE